MISSCVLCLFDSLCEEYDAILTATTPIQFARGRLHAYVELKERRSATANPTIPVVIVLSIKQKPPPCATLQLPVAF